MINLRVKQWRFRTQLLAVMVFLVTVPVITLGFLTYISSSQQIIAQVETDLRHHTQTLLGQVRIVHQLALEKLASDLAIAQYILATEGTPYLDTQDLRTLMITNQVSQQPLTVQIPTLKIGDRALWNSHELVDRMKSSSQLTATILQYLPEGLLRVSTNVLNQDQTRAIGTFIPPDSPVYQAISQGQPYRGRAFVVNDWYLGAYDPILGPNNTILGALYVGVKEAYYQESIKQGFQDLTIGKTGYIYILNPAGEYVLSAKGARDGENILNAQDENGHYFIQEIVTHAQQLSEQETGLIYYPWRNPGERRARRKMAAYSYFPAWEWIVATSAYQAEFLQGLQTLRAWTIGICFVFVLLTLTIAYSFSHFLGRAIALIVATLDQVAAGQLQQHHHGAYAANQEFNHIFAALSRMQYQLRDMVGRIANAAHNMSVTAQELAANVQSVTLSVNHMVTSIAKITQDTEKTNHLAQAGELAARHAEEGMQVISDRFDASAQTIGNLDEKTAEIDKITTLIHDISQQTNLLALNAAIEATRSGKAGKGFAVVATEIRQLSNEVQACTTEIQQSVDTLVQTIKNASATMQTGHGEITRSSQVINEALTALNAISQQVDNIALEVSYLKYTDDIARSMGEVTCVVTNLSAMAQELQGLVSQFKLQPNQ